MATRTVSITRPPGGTYYAYPDETSSTYSLANWTTHRVLLTESSAPNTGRYSGQIDDAKGTLWYIFQGASQPSDWDKAVAVVDFTLDAESDAILAAIAAVQAKTDLIGTGLASTGGVPVGDAGALSEIVIGDDYSTANGSAFVWTVSLPTGATIGGARCFFGGEHADPSLADANKWKVEGIVSEGPASGQAYITFNLLRSHTLNLAPGDYNWSAEIWNDAGLQSTRVRSKKTRRVTLVEKQTI